MKIFFEEIEVIMYVIGVLNIVRIWSVESVVYINREREMVYCD